MGKAMRVRTSIFAAAGLLVVMAMPAAAQGVDATLGGFGGDSPIAVAADSATHQGELTILQDEVVVTQDDTTVSADRMDIYRNTEESQGAQLGNLRLGSLNRIEAEGNFRFENPENTIMGRRGVYTAASRRFVVTGDVVLVRPDGSSVRGERLEYDLDSRAARFTGECEGGDCRRGRVNIRIE